MKRLTIAAIAAALAQFAVAETWYWSPTVQESPAGKTDKFYYWNNANNWTNSAAVRGRPANGDTALLGWGSAGSGAYYVCGNSSSYVMQEVRFEGNKSIGMNQGTLYLRAGGGGLKYMHNSASVSNWMGLRTVGDGEVPIHIDKNVNYALQIQMTQQNSTDKAVLVKTGPGRFICFNQAGARPYDIPLTLIRQGGFDITTKNTLSNITIAFDGNDESQRIYFCYGAAHLLDLVLNNCGFYETNGVANTAHGFSAQNDNQVKFTGTPKQNPTVFSGTFYSKAGLNWAPGSADYTFVCSNAVSATQGSVIVTKGTVKLVTGASFTALSKLDVAAGATFEVEEGSGANFHADALTLGNATAKLKLGTGVTLTMGAATLNGNPLPHGTYTADGADGTRTAGWIEGAGSVVVENGPDSMDVWSGGGADNLATTDANWESGAAPDITAGDLVATFAKGGTAAELPAGTAAAFDGIVLDSANLGGNAFAFTAGSGASASIGVSALTAIAAPAATTWTMGWPITLTGGAQTWNIGTNNTVKINAPISGDQDLTIAGSGTVELNVTSTHSGALTLDSGTFKVTADNALGAASRTVRYVFDAASLEIPNDVTIDSPIFGTWTTNDRISNGIKVAGGANVVFNGLVQYYSQGCVNVGAGGTVTFKKGLQVTVNGMSGFLHLPGNGTVIITNTPMTIHQRTTTASGGTATLDLRVAGNQLSVDSRYWCEFPSGTLVTRVANAIADRLSLGLGANGTFDLDGHDQTINGLFAKAAGAKVVSSRPATLTVKRSYDSEAYNQTGYGDTNRVDNTLFVGQVNLRKTGSFPYEMGAASSSTGTLKVVQGELRLSGSWANCTNMVAEGGTFVVKNVNAFGAEPNVEVDVTTGAKLKLAYTGCIDCTSFRLDGTKLYGTFGAPGSGADNEYAWISGTGLMRALPKGTTIIFR